MPVTLRPYAGPSDLLFISRMLAAADAVQPLGRFRTPEELRLWFDNPENNPTQDAILLEDTDGTCCGYLLLEPKWFSAEHLVGFARFITHPSYKAEGLDDQCLVWAEARMRQLGNGKVNRLEVHAVARTDSLDRIFSLEWNGYKPIRRYINMLYDYTQELPAAALPAGFSVRAVNPETEAEAWVDCYNHAFIDHWDFTPISAAFFHHSRQFNASQRPDHDLVVCDGDGKFAAVCWSQYDPSKFKAGTRREATLHQIGTRRGFRGRGIATALMVYALKHLQSDGIEAVRLFVDSENPTGAKRLYERLGFLDDYPLIFYGKTLT